VFEDDDVLMYKKRSKLRIIGDEWKSKRYMYSMKLLKGLRLHNQQDVALISDKMDVFFISF
jgi:hypothetical protein